MIRIIAISSIITVAIVGLLLVAMNQGCQTATIAQYGSPTGEYRADVRLRNCGPFTGFLTWVDIVDLRDRGEERVRAFVFGGDAGEVTARWVAESNLLISYEYCREIDDAMDAWKSITIGYHFTPRSSYGRHCT